MKLGTDKTQELVNDEIQSDFEPNSDPYHPDAP
jgi:hypothetical protein